MGHSEAMYARRGGELPVGLPVGNVGAYFELGVDYSVGRHGIEIDLVEAHKWFNLAALSGDRRAQASRAEVAEEMSVFEIAEAQRQARAWLAAGPPAAA